MARDNDILINESGCQSDPMSKIKLIQKKQDDESDFFLFFVTGYNKMQRSCGSIIWNKYQR